MSSPVRCLRCDQKRFELVGERKKWLPWLRKYKGMRRADQHVVFCCFQNHIDSKSASAMFELLKKKLNFTSAYQHFTSILFHFLHMPSEYTHTQAHTHSLTLAHPPSLSLSLSLSFSLSLSHSLSLSLGRSVGLVSPHCPLPHSEAQNTHTHTHTHTKFSHQIVLKNTHPHSFFHTLLSKTSLLSNPGEFPNVAVSWDVLSETNAFQNTHSLKNRTPVQIYSCLLKA